MALYAASSKFEVETKPSGMLARSQFDCAQADAGLAARPAAATASAIFLGNYSLPFFLWQTDLQSKSVSGILSADFAAA